MFLLKNRCSKSSKNLEHISNSRKKVHRTFNLKRHVIIEFQSNWFQLEPKRKKNSTFHNFSQKVRTFELGMFKERSFSWKIRARKSEKTKNVSSEKFNHQLSIFENRLVCLQTNNTVIKLGLGLRLVLKVRTCVWSF